MPSEIKEYVFKYDVKRLTPQAILYDLQWVTKL